MEDEDAIDIEAGDDAQPSVTDAGEDTGAGGALPIGTPEDYIANPDNENTGHSLKSVVDWLRHKMGLLGGGEQEQSAMPALEEGYPEDESQPPKPPASSTPRDYMPKRQTTPMLRTSEPLSSAPAGAIPSMGMGEAAGDYPSGDAFGGNGGGARFLGYLSGALPPGAPPANPQEVKAKEQQTGSPEKAITQAAQEGGPAKGAAYLQSYRQRSDAHRANAVAALEGGNLPIAIQEANQVIKNVPGAPRLTFAQAPDGSITASMQRAATAAPSQGAPMTAQQAVEARKKGWVLARPGDPEPNANESLRQWNKANPTQQFAVPFESFEDFLKRGLFDKLVANAGRGVEAALKEAKPIRIDRGDEEGPKHVTIVRGSRTGPITKETTTFLPKGYDLENTSLNQRAGLAHPGNVPKQVEFVQEQENEAEKSKAANQRATAPVQAADIRDRGATARKLVEVGAKQQDARATAALRYAGQQINAGTSAADVDKQLRKDTGKGVGDWLSAGPIQIPGGPRAPQAPRAPQVGTIIHDNGVPYKLAPDGKWRRVAQ